MGPTSSSLPAEPALQPIKATKPPLATRASATNATARFTGLILLTREAAEKGLRSPANYPLSLTPGIVLYISQEPLQPGRLREAFDSYNPGIIEFDSNAGTRHRSWKSGIVIRSIGVWARITCGVPSPLFRSQRQGRRARCRARPPALLLAGASESRCRADRK